jgi:hypothetical protein
MFFTNTLFPNHGAIGDEALHPDEDGTVSLPVGFDYRAAAQVDCDGGETIVNEYTPKLTFSTKRTDPRLGRNILFFPGILAKSGIRSRIRPKSPPIYAPVIFPTSNISRICSSLSTPFSRATSITLLPLATDSFTSSAAFAYPI